MKFLNKIAILVLSLLTTHAFAMDLKLTVDPKLMV